MNDTKIWHSPALAGTLFLQAHFTRHSFEPHFHDEYAIGIIDAGCQAFTYDRGRRLDMPGGSVALIAPGVVHTGWSGIEGGWRYRMLYPSRELMHAFARDIFAVDTPPTFHVPVVEDPELFALLSRLHLCSDAEVPEPLEAEELCLEIVARAVGRHAGQRPPRKQARHVTALRRVRDLLEDRVETAPSLEELGTLAEMSRFSLLRQFRALYGLSPHAYLRQCRVKRARDAILKGDTLPDAAFASGFADQAHMTRVFRRTLGFTPGALARSVG